MSGWIVGVFLALIAFHTLYALSRSIDKARQKDENARVHSRLNVAFQTVIFLLGARLAYDWGALSRDLLSPVAIAAGLLAGHFIFGLSLLATHSSMEDARGHFLDFGSVWDFVVEHPYVLSRFIYVGISEEIIWRGATQPALASALGWGLGDGIDPLWPTLAAIGIVAVAFSVVHDHFFHNAPMVTAEFLGFALLLGVLYYWTGSLIMVIIIHAVRDIEIAYLEFAINVHEFGDEEKAAAEVERVYRHGLRNSHE
ncbi:MAG: CPBP family intramembrane metalloprotease [Candidatus Hydrogenedentes bacterium]|nr:CPBP family intramembrane metalloprotease [Candidatus Hydrogenedentota bacterium]